MRSLPYTVVDLEQNTPAWLQWRQQGLGASDAPTIMGENRYKSPAQLLAEKRNPLREVVLNPAMILGHQLEPEARARYMDRVGREVRPLCLQSTLHPWLRASLDGLSDDHETAVEIKCGESAYRWASQSRMVPDHYYGQLQHILAVTGLLRLDFWCYWPGQPEVLIPVSRDEEYIARMLHREEEFWGRVQGYV